VTGRLGAPAASVALLAAAADPSALEAARGHPAAERLGRPAPRLVEAAWLAARAPLHALIDVSDGVSSDAGHVARRSRVRILLEPDRIPVHPAAADVAARLGSEARDWALHGGEEFELLLAAPPGAIEPLVQPFEARFGIPITRIGSVEAGRGLAASDGGPERPLAPGGWDHFRVAPSDPSP
jgi:thiamine-monophosphate kinase